MPPQPTQQIPGVYHRKIGDIVVTAISDGFLDGNLDVMRNVDLEKAHQILRDAFRPARRTSVNAFLVHSKGRIAIVDTGLAFAAAREAWDNGQIQRGDLADDVPADLEHLPPPGLP